MADDQAEKIREEVRTGYGKIAAQTECCGSAACCGAGPELSSKLAAQIGYSDDELAALPEGANMGLSCGNPAAIASLRPGETVLDLGSGAGFDAFIVARKVGAHGHVIGVDMTSEMLSKARRNIAAFHARTGLENVEFRLGEIEHLPVADNCVDVIISNCVLNLSPDKAQVWREIYRVLKPGGRAAISDIALLKPLPQSVRQMVEALIGCVAGAVLMEETLEMAKDAGLSGIVLTPKPQYVEAMIDANDPLYAEIVQHLPPNAKPSDYITSLSVSARKPM